MTSESVEIRHRQYRGTPLPVSDNSCLHRGHRVAMATFHGVHSIIVENSAQPVEGGGARLPPFTLSTITYKAEVYASANRAETFPLFLLYPYMHCKETILQIQNKYYQKRNCAAPALFHIHVYVSDLYIPTIELPILLQENMWIVDLSL